MQIKVEKDVGGIRGLCVITPAVHGDRRGYFMETYSLRDMEEAGLKITFVQDNQSQSCKGVLRGLHYQINFPQTKLVRVIKGAVFDVAVIACGVLVAYLWSYVRRRFEPGIDGETGCVVERHLQKLRGPGIAELDSLPIVDSV